MASNTWPARRSLGGDAAVWVAIALLFLALAAVFLGGSRETGTGMLLLCALATLLAGVGFVLLVLGIAYRRLVYTLAETALHIDWLGQTLVVPYAAIQGIYTGQRLSGHATPGVPRWPGISVGPARVRGLGRLRFFATSTDQSLLTLVTVVQGGVVVSARDPHEFRAALIERVEESQDEPPPATLAGHHASSSATLAGHPASSSATPAGAPSPATPAGHPVSPSATPADHPASSSATPAGMPPSATLAGHHAEALIWHQQPPTTAPWTALADAWLPLCAVLGTLLVLLVLAIIVFRFDTLPNTIPLHFGAPDQSNYDAPKSDLLRLPLIGLAVLVVNWLLGTWLHPRERLLARLLWLGGVIVQVVLLMGVLRLVA